MANSDRMIAIEDYIRKKKEVSLRELCDRFSDVTEMTIRRDLNALQSQGIILRTWGGAKLNEDLVSEEYSHASRSMHSQAEKAIVAEKAAALIDAPTSIFIDSGTTTLELAKRLPREFPLFVLTNNPAVSNELWTHDNCEVLVSGGKLSKTVGSLTGELGLHAFDNININIAFLAAVGVSATAGFTNAHQGECLLKRKAIECATTRVMLVDSNKMNSVLAYKICGFDKIDILVSDAPVPPEIRRACEEAGTRIID